MRLYSDFVYVCICMLSPVPDLDVHKDLDSTFCQHTDSDPTKKPGFTALILTMGQIEYMGISLIQAAP